LLLAGVAVVEIVAATPPPPMFLPPPPPTSQASLGFSSQEELISAHTTSGPSWAAVHLVKAKVFVQFSEAVENDCSKSVLDTSATNHMTGSRYAFSMLDRSIHGTVNFGDGSVVQIKGVSTILFSCKTGEHQAFGVSIASLNSTPTSTSWGSWMKWDFRSSSMEEF
jgi:hypothetical protein